VGYQEAEQQRNVARSPQINSNQKPKSVSSAGILFWWLTMLKIHTWKNALFARLLFSFLFIFQEQP